VPISNAVHHPRPPFPPPPPLPYPPEPPRRPAPPPAQPRPPVGGPVLYAEVPVVPGTDPVLDKLLEERIVYLGREVDDEMANRINAQLLLLAAQDPERDITMYINSPGGSYTAMTAIYDTMQYVRPDIQTVCLGQAASAAALLLAGGTRGKRLALPSSRILIHQPALAGSQGQGSDLEIVAREILRMRSQLEELLAQHTGQPLDRVHRDIDRDKIMTAEEAKEYGVVDVVLPSRKKSLAAA
jgi:ATP-dependent Clp protease, protease subunit